MYAIYADVPISRRKTFNHVLDHNETLVFTAPGLAACLIWLVQNGETECLVHTPDHKLKLDLVPLPN